MVSFYSFHIIFTHKSAFTIVQSGSKFNQANYSLSPEFNSGIECIYCSFHNISYLNVCLQNGKSEYREGISILHLMVEFAFLRGQTLHGHHLEEGN